MTNFNWEKNREHIQEWKELFSTVFNSLPKDVECKIETPLYTHVMVEKHTFKKSKLLSLKAVENSSVGKYISIQIENEDGKSYVNVYPQFELKTEGKIRDIVMIMIFVRNNVITKTTKPVIV